MSLYSDYIRERLGQETIEHEWGFLTYAIRGEAFEVQDCYVRPEDRKSGKAQRIMDEAFFRAKQAGARRVVAWVWPGFPGADFALRAMLKYGFRLYSAEGGRTVVVKELDAD